MLPDRKERDEQRQQLQEAAEAVAAKEMDNGVRINPLLAAMHFSKCAETRAAGDTECASPPRIEEIFPSAAPSEPPVSGAMVTTQKNPDWIQGFALNFHLHF